MLTLTIAALRWHEACDLDSRIADITTHLGREVGEDEAVPLATWMELESTSTADAIWALQACEPAASAHVVAVRVAALAARRVLHLVPDGDRPACLAAIEAAEAWVSDPTPERARAVIAVANALSAKIATDAVAAVAAAANAAYDAEIAAAYSDAVHDAVIATARASRAAGSAAERAAQRADLIRLLTETP